MRPTNINTPKDYQRWNSDHEAIKRFEATVKHSSRQVVRDWNLFLKVFIIAAAGLVLACLVAPRLIHELDEIHPFVSLGIALFCLIGFYLWTVVRRK